MASPTDQRHVDFRGLSDDDLKARFVELFDRFERVTGVRAALRGTQTGQQAELFRNQPPAWRSPYDRKAIFMVAAGMVVGVGVAAIAAGALGAAAAAALLAKVALPTLAVIAVAQGLVYRHDARIERREGNRVRSNAEMAASLDREAAQEVATSWRQQGRTLDPDDLEVDLESLREELAFAASVVRERRGLAFDRPPTDQDIRETMAGVRASARSTDPGPRPSGPDFGPQGPTGGRPSAPELF